MQTSLTPSADLAWELMFYAADTLGYLRPISLPEIIINPDMEALGQFVSCPSVVTLKHWREDSLFDQCVLVHELVHHVQSYNGATLNGNVFEGINHIEIEALTVQCLWLRSVGEDPHKLISERTILKLTGDATFATLNWIEAA